MERLRSVTKITTFLPHSPFDNKNCECASNLLLYPFYSNLSGSGTYLFLVNLTTSNKQLPREKFVFKYPDKILCKSDPLANSVTYCK